jgi:hypothetical protein
MGRICKFLAKGLRMGICLVKLFVDSRESSCVYHEFSQHTCADSENRTITHIRPQWKGTVIAPQSENTPQYLRKEKR